MGIPLEPPPALMRSPRQNRVDPWGALHAIDARGTLMGNRGMLHDEGGRIVRAAQTGRWITCLLEFGNVRRQIFSIKSYSELFFLDEATAFSAGHRPCAQCQRERYNAFRKAWAAGNGMTVVPGADDLDLALRAEGKKHGHIATINELPCGSFFCIGDTAFLVCRQGVRPWSFFGYGELTDVDRSSPVQVLTPKSVVEAFRSGFEPRLHSSADRN